jgi:tetratricopeptide (TPR) repeat protein
MYALALVRKLRHFRHSWGAVLLSALLVIALCGCSGAYGQAIARGDDYAKAGLWDKAAKEYESAVKLDPNEPDAVIKLKEVRRKQSAERLAKGRSLLQRGEIEKALAVLQEAARLDPESVEAQQALADANSQALRKAETLLDQGNAKKAFDITSLILKDSPNDPRARALDGKVRDVLAEEGYTRAEAFLKNKKPGNALMELAACVSYRPGYRDAKLRIGEIKLALEQELTFYVILDRFADETSAKDIAQTLNVDLLSQSFDQKLPLRVVPALQSAKKDARGIRLSGKFDGYNFSHDKDKQGRSCDYVCGSDTKPNPDYDNAERDVASAEKRLADIENQMADKQKDVDRYQKDVDSIQKDVDRAEVDVDKARADLDKCTANRKPTDSSSACSSEDSRLRSAQSSLDSVRSRIQSPKSNLSSARERLMDAQKEREDVRRRKDDQLQRMRSTPRTIEVNRYCAHNYSVDVHTVSARLTVQLTAEHLEDKSRLLDNEPFEYKESKKDISFPAQQGRCAEVAAGDALQIPSEKEIKVALVTQAIGGVREKVMASYERYRQRFLADARREEASGLADEAVEAYVRYLLTAPKGLNPKDERQIGDFLQKTRGFGKLDSLGGL